LTILNDYVILKGKKGADMKSMAISAFKAHALQFYRHLFMMTLPTKLS
jgi:hypothetical protein